jgi:hypothetical protein
MFDGVATCELSLNADAGSVLISAPFYRPLFAIFPCRHRQLWVACRPPLDPNKPYGRCNLKIYETNALTYR